MMRSVIVAALAVAVLGSARPSLAQQASNLDTVAWETINQKIVDIYKGLDKKAPETISIHLMGVPKALPIDDPIDFKAAYLDVADTIPNWSATWTPTEKRFSDQYRLFVGAIAVPTRSDVKAADFAKANKAHETLSASLSAANRALDKEWNAYTAAQEKNKRPVLPWNDFVNSYSKNGPRRTAIEADFLNAQATLFNMYDPGARVIGQFKKRAEHFVFNADDVIDGVPRYPYAYDTARNALATIAKDAAINQANGKVMFSWDSTRDTLQRSEERMSWGASASFRPFLGTFFPLSASGSGSGSRYSLDQSESSAAISIRAYGFGRVSIVPGGWWAPTLISWFKKEGALLPGDTVKASSLWGKDGLLPLRPVELLVMVRPTLTAKLSKSDYHRVVETLNAGGSVSFGPFSFGGSYSKTTEKIDKDDQNGLITFTNTSDTPYIIAVISQRF